MLAYLIDLIGRLGHWGYAVLFFGAMLESAAFLGIVVPGESLVLAAGFFAAQHLLDLDALIVVVSIGATLGDSIGYEMGRRLGRTALREYGGRFGITEARIDKAERLFVRHGGKAVFFGRFIGFARALVPFLAGSAAMPYRQFLPFNALGAVLWTVVATLLGYVLGASWGLAERWVGRASAILAGFLAFAALMYWLGRQVVRHEAGIRQRWDAWQRHSQVAHARRRLAPIVAFLQARLSPSGYLGLRLTVGAIVLLGAAWLFGGIAEDVVHGDPLTQVDDWLAQWLHARAVPWLTSVMLAVSALHGTPAMTVWTALTALGLTWRRRWHWLLALLLSVPLGMLVNALMKLAFARARPQFEHPLVVLASYSFPSGHVAASTLFYGFLCALYLSRSVSWPLRVAAVLAAGAMIVLVAFSRLYLGAHYLSDVLAAIAEGIAWLALCLTGVHVYGAHREPRAGQDGAAT